MTRRKSGLARIFAFFLVCTSVCTAQSPQYFHVRPDVVKDRLSLYKGEDDERRMTLMRLFVDAGCRDGRLEIQPVTKADAPNVICTLPGKTDDIIVVGAHFDRVNKGEGVADNWSGASLLPSLYQSLNLQPRRHTFVFIGFSDEEEGFIGSGFYVDHLADKKLASVKAMVNIDTLGLDSTRVWASNSNSDLVSLLKQVARTTRLPIDVMNVDGMGDSDEKSFKKRDVPVITLHSVTLENFKILHSTWDRFAAIKMDDYYDSYNLIAAYLATLDIRWGEAGIIH